MGRTVTLVVVVGDSGESLDTQLPPTPVIQSALPLLLPPPRRAGGLAGTPCLQSFLSTTCLLPPHRSESTAPAPYSRHPFCSAALTQLIGNLFYFCVGPLPLSPLKKQLHLCLPEWAAVICPSCPVELPHFRPVLLRPGPEICIISKHGTQKRGRRCWF